MFGAVRLSLMYFCLYIYSGQSVECTITARSSLCLLLLPIYMYICLYISTCFKERSVKCKSFYIDLWYINVYNITGVLV